MQIRLFLDKKTRLFYLLKILVTMTTICTPKNPQNDRVYAPATSKKRNIAAGWLLRTRTTFTKSIMISVGVSKLGWTHLIFVDPGIKINEAYYRDVLLKQEMLPDIRATSGNFIFQQDNALVHRARETVALLQREVPLRFHCSQSVASQQPRPQPCWLQGVGYDAGLCSSGEGARCWWSETAFDWRVRQSGAKRHRRRDRPVAFTTLCLCPCERETFRTVFVTCIWTSS